MLLSMLFQFHEGPIKTLQSSGTDITINKFQFHEGPIKTLVLLNLSVSPLCFNSMKVRLKPAAHLS